MKSSFVAAALSAALTVLALSLPPANASTVIEKDFASLCREADMIFAGRVSAVQSRWSDESRRSIETVVTFSVDDAVFGVTGNQVQLTFAGGEMDGLREVTGGIPEFRAGEEVVIFASNKRSISPIIGFNQGSFRVANGLVSNVDGLPVTGVSQRGLSLGEPAASERGLPLAQFLGAVREQLSKRTESAP